jgi:hypothetical protein
MLAFPYRVVMCSELPCLSTIWGSHSGDMRWDDLMMEAARTTETLVKFYQTTRRYNPEDSHLPCPIHGRDTGIPIELFRSFTHFLYENAATPNFVNDKEFIRRCVSYI